MKKLHIINLEKMGGVERLFLQHINDDIENTNEILCINSQVGSEIEKKLAGKKSDLCQSDLQPFLNTLSAGFA